MMYLKRSCWAFLSLALLSMPMNADALPITRSLECSLTFAPSASPSADVNGVTLVLHLRNSGGVPLKVLRRNTPLEPMLSDHLRITRNGQRLPYVGRLAKRGAPTAQEYLTLEPGERVAHSFALNDGYDLSRSGTYRIQWSGELMDVVVGNTAVNPEQPTPQQVACAALTFKK